MKRKGFSDEEDEQMIDYLIETVQNQTRPLVSRTVWTNYMRIKKSKRRLSVLHVRMVYSLGEKIQKSKKINDDKKVHILFATVLPIGPKLLERVRKSGADIQIGEHNHIMSYEKGNLKLSVYKSNGELHSDHLRRRLERVAKKRAERDDEEDPEEPEDELMPDDPFEGYQEEEEEIQEMEELEGAQNLWSSSTQLPVILKNETFTSEPAKPVPIHQARDYSSAGNALEMKLVQFYQHLKYFVLSLNSTGFQELREHIDEKILMCIGVETVPSENLYFILKSTLNSVLMQSVPNATSSSEEFIELSKFLVALQIVVVNMEMPSLADFQKRVEDSKKEAGNLKKKISISDVRLALQNAIAMI